MAPSSASLPPSPSTMPVTSSSFCCCSRYFRRSTPPTQNQNGRSGSVGRAPIEIKVNGRSHLTVPHVAIVPPRADDEVVVLERAVDNLDGGGGGHLGRRKEGGQEIIQLSQVLEEGYETARTSRHTDDAKLVPMKELIRMVRIEEGLEVTPRQVVPQEHYQRRIQIGSHHQHHHHHQQQQQPRPPPLQLNVVNLPTTSSSSSMIHPTIDGGKKIRRAVFNEDGDITTRTMSGRKYRSDPHINGQIVSNENTDRRISIGSLGVPVLPPLPPSQSMSSAISRRISSTPQVIAAFIAFTYACVTTILTTITNIFSRS